MQRNDRTAKQELLCEWTGDEIPVTYTGAQAGGDPGPQGGRRRERGIDNKGFVERTQVEQDGQSKGPNNGGDADREEAECVQSCMEWLLAIVEMDDGLSGRSNQLNA